MRTLGGLPALLCHLDPGREGLWKLSLILLTVLDPKRQACCSVVPDVRGAVALVQMETSRAVALQLSEHVTKISIFDPHWLLLF